MVSATTRRPDDEITCEVGDEVELAGTFTADGGIPLSPRQVYLRILYPSGEAYVWHYGEQADLESLTPGAFRMLWVPQYSGRYYWRLWGVGDGVTRAHVGSILVEDDPTSTEDNVYAIARPTTPRVTFFGVGTVT